MKTLRSTAPVWQSIGVALVLSASLTLAACGSSSTSSSSSSSSSQLASPATSASESTSIPTSALPAPTTIPATQKGTCSALAAALTLDELQPKNSGNWNAERQRILVDAASNVGLYAAAQGGAPAEIKGSVKSLENYATKVGEIVAESSSADSAVAEISRSSQLAAATPAAAIVTTWKQKNC
ncbi:MAG: hypothetical protein WEA11_04260 [Acidimicrobiales bacterium]